MKKFFFFLLTTGVLGSCSGPKFFDKPSDFVGGNRAAAVETHCYRTGGMNKEGMAYKLCQEGFKTHYGN